MLDAHGLTASSNSAEVLFVDQFHLSELVDGDEEIAGSDDGIQY